MPLHNAFVESVSCVGFSSSRGLQPESNFNDPNFPFFIKYFQPALLSVVNADRAIYPQADGVDIIDGSYPRFSGVDSKSMSTTLGNNANKTTANSSNYVVSRIAKQHMIPGPLRNLPLFCFPDPVKPVYKHEKEKIHHIVMTQEEGKRSYALVLTFQQSFTLKSDIPDDDGIYQIDDYVEARTTINRRPSVSRIPVAIHRQQSATSSTNLNSTPGTTTATSTRSSRVPSSFRYAAPTFSSKMKSLSATSSTPPTRLARRNSQTSLFDSQEDLTMSVSLPRKRSNSNSSTSSLMTTSLINQNGYDTKRPFYLPHCIVLVSSQPYWTAMQETISIIHDELVGKQIEINSETYKILIQKFTFLVCNTPVPPIPWGRFSLSLNLTYDQSVLTFDPPFATDRSVIDLDLSILLLTLNIGKLLDIMSGILTQQPLMFFSENYSTLVTIPECLLYLIYPLKWIHVYVPLVPDALRDYYEAGPPGSFIMGAHARHQATVQELDMCLVCNLDDEKPVYIPPKLGFQKLPSNKLRRFSSQITKLTEKIKLDRAKQNMNTTVRLRINQQREDERQNRTETNEKIIQIFLDFMIDLFGDTLKPIYWRIHHQQASPTNSLNRSSPVENRNSLQTGTMFSKEAYLRSKVEGLEKEFYQIFISTSAFQLFIEQEKLESQSLSDFRKFCEAREWSDENRTFDPDESSSDDETEDDEKNDMPPDADDEGLVMTLPDWSLNASTHYLDGCIEVFTDELGNSQEDRSIAVVTSLAYLRGCALLARGHLLDGLRDLYAIENRALFPLDYIQNTVVKQLADALLLNVFLQEQFYVDAADWKKIHTRPLSQRMSILDLEPSGNFLDEKSAIDPSNNVNNQTNWSLTSNELNYKQFSDYVHRLSIVLDQTTTEILYKCLLNWTNQSSNKNAKKNKFNSVSLRKTTTNGKPYTRSSSATGRSTDTSKISRIKYDENAKTEDSDDGNGVSIYDRSLPSTLFDLFLEAWQQTNTEKVRMNRYLPENRKKQESVLKVSSSGVIWKKDGPGQLLLTQKRLYFLPEALGKAHLLTEMKNINSIEKYHYQYSISSSKPSLKISLSPSSASSSLERDGSILPAAKPVTIEKEAKSTVSLLFKTQSEQHLWYNIIVELNAGATIANAHVDIAVLNRASRHVVLMDTLANINYYPESERVSHSHANEPSLSTKQRFNEINIESALTNLSIFTQMIKDGTGSRLPYETRDVITRRLSPSINETEHVDVRCLVFCEHPDGGRPSLWCAYGSKLKVFNIPRWICDANTISFSSTITCMCLDARSKLWVGCCDGKVFVVDTVSRIRGEELISIGTEGGCQSMVFDPYRNVMLVADRTGLVIQWNASNWQRLEEFVIGDLYRKSQTNQDTTVFKSQYKLILGRAKGPTANNNSIALPSTDPADNNSVTRSSAGTAQVIPSPSDRLKSIQIYENHLFACFTFDYIIVLRLNDSGAYIYEQVVSVKYKMGEGSPIDAFVVYNNQLWISTGNIIYIFDVSRNDKDNTYNLLWKRVVEDDRLSVLAGFTGYIWAGSVNGSIYIFRMKDYELHKVYPEGHKDTVCCLTLMSDRYVISGSGARDTSINIWDNIQSIFSSASSNNSATSMRVRSSRREDL